MNLFDLTDRVVVLTGATGVLGTSIISYFALQGAKVVLVVRERSIEKGECIAQDIRNAGGDALCVIADVMNKESLEKTVEKCYIN